MRKQKVVPTLHKNNAFLLLGGNQGDSLSIIKQSIEQFEERIGRVVRCSSIYETEPWGFETDQNFLNMVLQIETHKTAQALLKECLFIEEKLGRIRVGNTYSSRTIDIDILFFNNEIISQPNLTIPHPLLQDRRFVLQPLSDIACEFIHPGMQKTINQLLLDCPDHSKVSFFSKFIPITRRNYSPQ